jgi:hypothetical protein
MKKAQYKKTKSGKSWDFEWQLTECRWFGLIANSKRKKWVKDSLTRNYHRKQKQEKLDADEDADEKE